MSKKVLVAVVSALLLILFMAAGVLAAQKVDFNGSGNGDNDYAETPQDQVYLPNATSPGDYKIHSNYTSTTEACASCHTTHTGIGEALLQFGSATDTCMTCHDGTVTSTYDVKHGLIGTTGALTAAGMFGDETEPSASSHNVSGNLKISAAPGGIESTEPDYANLNDDGVQVSWDVKFGCQSCHDPHGQGGNARLLSPDPNGVGWVEYNKGDNATQGGTKNVTLTGYDVTNYTSDWNKNGVADTWILGYPYPNVVYVNGTKVTNVALDNSLGYTLVKFTSPIPNAQIDKITADFVPGLVVKMNITNYLQPDERVSHITGLNDFCGACHTKFKNFGHLTTGHVVGVDATFAQAQVDERKLKLENGNVSCETCHVAHGINENYWNANLPESVKLFTDFDGNPVVGPETSGSSSLKRIPNMGTCETCHNDSKV